MKHLSVIQPSAELINPHLWTDSRSYLGIRSSIFEALVKRDPQGGYLPSLATQWHIDPDARTWTFKIRQGVSFHNGAILTAEDVKASLEHACSPDIPGSYGTDALLNTYLGSAEIKVIDRETVRLITPEPMADLLDLLVHTMIVPADVLTRTGVSTSVGSGPYRMELASTGQVTVAGFEKYWNGSPAINKITFKGVPTIDQRLEAFCSGSADMITYIPPVYRDRIEKVIPGSFHELKIPLCIILIFNLLSPKCQDVRVRQALNYGVNVDELIRNVMGGHAVRLNGPLSPQHSGCNAATTPYAYDPGHARQLLHEAGFPQGIELAFDVPTRSPDESPELARHLEGQYQQIGVNLRKTVHEDRPAYAYMVKEKRFEDVCIFDSSPGSTYRVLREKINSKIAGPWWAGYNNSKVDLLMEKAWKTIDSDERTRIYRQISAIVYEDAPWVFLYNPTDGVALRPELKGLKSGVEGLLP
jgi:peptide/nickel transport system substrate-binding protein